MIKIASAKILNPLADQWLVSRALNPVTTRAYRLETNRFIKWIASRESRKHNLLDSNLIAKYFSIVGSDQKEQFSQTGISKPLQTSSMLQTKRIINSWMRWSASMGLVKPELALATEWKPPMRSNSDSELSRKQIKSLLTLINSNKTPESLSELRTKVLVSMAFWLGAKPSEISVMKFKDIRVTNAGIEVLLPKRASKPLWVTGPPQIKEVWKSYSSARGCSKFAISAIHDSEKPVSASSIGRIIRRHFFKKMSSDAVKNINTRQLNSAYLYKANAIGLS